MKEIYYRMMKDGDFESMDFPNEMGLQEHPDLPKWGKIRLEEGQSFVSMDRYGEIICCFGCQILWPGVGEVWVAFSGLMKDYIREIAVETRIILNMMQSDLKLWRLQADVLTESEVSNNFIKHYGFEYEGTMKAYNPYGLDMNRYARVRR